MCGILGQIERKNGAIDLAAFTRMLGTLAFRGPDASGQYMSSDRRVALGHQRLSIVDLSEAANQPIPNEDGSIWLTCNGEIYNHGALRTQLTDAGHRFRSHSVRYP